MIAYHLVDDVAERYLDLIDAVNDEIDELEENIEDWPAEKSRRRLSELRHDLLHIRRTLAPTRDAVREHRRRPARARRRRREAFPRQVELHFADAYDKLLARLGRARARTRPRGERPRLPAGARSRTTRTRSMKKLTAIASILLVPTFIVGLYGQNFISTCRSSSGRFGYWWSWG